MIEPQRIVLNSVARVLGGRPEMYEDNWYDVKSVIRLDDRFEPSALQGLQEFSHLEIVFQFDRIDENDVPSEPRPPRKNPDGPLVGVFAHRGPYRPNRLGVSVCRLLAVDGRDLHVAGLDALDGTPVLDIKPYLVEFGPSDPVRQPAWTTRLMSDYYKAKLVFPSLWRPSSRRRRRRPDKRRTPRRA